MSKYVKLEDAIYLARTGRLIGNNNFKSVCKALNSLPTIEVSEDAISRADLIESFLADCECESRKEARAVTLKLDDMLELIDDAPSVIPEPEEGEWEWETDDICHNCGYKIPHLERVIGETVLMDSRDWQYCPNCGAKMFAKDINVPIQN